MELPDIGQRCADPGCKQLDFLALTCRCGKVFCSLLHFNPHSQICTESRYLDEDQLKTVEKVYICSKDGCKERSVVPLVCQRCDRHFCIKHRHLTECNPKSQEQLDKERARYDEPVKSFNAAKALVDQEVASNLAQAKTKTKHREMAAKVQLMKIKNKATGLKSIPTTDRVYFNVKFNDSLNQPLFVSKTWSLGRAIDAIALECRLQNNNNKSNQKKLRLFNVNDKCIVSRDMSINLEKLLSENTLVNGSDIIIEYVDDNCLEL
ncbi:hypothetical protein GWI33_013630 [Rhynchophorus ferrugineus]|uniref:ZFAND1-like ubiquitin-like domain-containing protein n=1 Tax=Rhynchophorus ferrugineus TaxID=354439 RepID=A0A834I8U6_RHYFE|nr:hypothetical protein GWI33_013630 [Rhynchophorus ferrugineus]